jgi:D-arabinose 1-dehydrogenase-like Zn-dependent alcohol dehydrogenase
MAEFERVAILGVGLIGGSIGMALRERRLVREVVGIGRNEANLLKARQLGAVDRFTTELAEGVADADLTIVCTPVDTIADFVRQISDACHNSALITDAGSTKADIVAAVERQQAGRKGGPHFVGSHPLAGDHRTGVEVARPDLLVGRKVIVTPTANTDRDALAKIESFWRRLSTTKHWRRRAICRTSWRLRWRPRRRKICSPWRQAVGGIQRGLPAAIPICGDRFSPRIASKCSRHSSDSKDSSGKCGLRSPLATTNGC